MRVSAPAALGVLRLNRLMQDFLSRWPDVEVEFLLDDRVIDLVEEGIDVALRLGGPLPPNVVARRIAISRRGLVASPAYLSAHRRLRHPRDLADHEYLRFAWASEQLELHGPKHDTHTMGVRGRYRINNSLGIRECLLLGTGIGLAPGWLVQDLVQTGELVRVLPAWQAAPHEAFVVYRRAVTCLRGRVRSSTSCASGCRAWSASKQPFDRASRLVNACGRLLAAPHASKAYA